MKDFCVGIRGVSIDDHQFSGRLNAGGLKVIAKDHQRTFDGVHKGTVAADSEDLAMRAMLPNALTTAKRKNARSYASYIQRMLVGEPGVLPPVQLWTSQSLDVFDNGDGETLELPLGLRLVALDGGTQLMAHLLLDKELEGSELFERHEDMVVPVIFHHGVPFEEAQQYFVDMQTQGVRPTAAVSITNRQVDIAAQIAYALEEAVPFLQGRVEHNRRQLGSANEDKVVTQQTLRQMVINVRFGINGLQYGTRRAPITQDEVSRLTDICTRWFSAYFWHFGGLVRKRRDYVAGTTPVLVAVAAGGNALWQADDTDIDRLIKEHIDLLDTVDWTKGLQWVGILGQWKKRGFGVGSPKEVGHLVYRALFDENSPEFTAVAGPQNNFRRRA